MRKITLSRRLLAVTMGMLLGVCGAWADAISLPCTRVDFAQRTEFNISGETTGTKGLELGNNGAYYGLGSCKGGNYCTLQVTNATAQTYLFAMQMKEGNGNSGTVKFTLTDTSDETKTYTVGAISCPSTNNELRDFVGELSNLPVGTYNMRIDFTAGGTWAPNLYNLAIVAKNDFAKYNTRLISPATVDLEKALKTQNFTTKTNEISSTRNGYDVAYIINCGEAGTYSVDFDASAVDTGVSIDATVFNVDGTPGGTANNVIANSGNSSDWSQYATYHAENLTLKAGCNVVRFKFNKSGGTNLTWAVANVKNVTLTKTADINQIPAASFAMNLGVRADRPNTAFKSDKLVDSNQRGSYFVYRANVTTAGNYILSIGSYCDQPNTKQPSFTVLITDANGVETSQTFTITNDGTNSPVDETFKTNAINLPAGICTIKISFASATNNLWTTNLTGMKFYSVLDEAIAFTPTAMTTNVSMTRTMAANKWSTFVAPFAMTAEQVTSNFGAGAKVAKLTGVNGTALTFATATATEANVPVMIYPSQDVTTITADGVTIEEGTPTQTESTVSFVGNYGGQVSIPQGAYFVANNNLYQASDNSNTMKNFRAYFTTTGGARLSGFTFDGETTAVQSVAVSQQQAEQVYDLQGRRVSQPQKGLYIVNGKKIVVK